LFIHTVKRHKQYSKLHINLLFTTQIANCLHFYRQSAVQSSVLAR